MSGPLPDEVRTLRALDLGIGITEVDNMSALRLDELLTLDAIRKEADGGGSG